jgi:cytochrome P450
VDTFIFEGHDTTATGLMWTIYCISQHPEVEQKVMQEVDEILGNYSYPADYEMLKRFSYLTCVIKEVYFLLLIMIS